MALKLRTRTWWFCLLLQCLARLKTDFFISKLKVRFSRKIRKIIALTLIYCQLFNFSAAVAAPFIETSSLPLQSNKTNSHYFNSLPSSLPPGQGASTSNLSLTNQNLGLSGPLSWGATYSDLTGTFLNAQYAVSLGKLAMMALGE